MKTPINDYYYFKSDILKTIITSIFLSIGTNFIFLHFEKYNYKFLIIGFLIILLSILFFFLIGLEKVKYKYKISGYLIYVNENYLSIPGYKVSVNTNKIYNYYIKERPNNKIGKNITINDVREILGYQIINILSDCTTRNIEKNIILKPKDLKLDNQFLNCFSDSSKIVNNNENGKNRKVILSYTGNGCYRNSDISVPKGTVIKEKQGIIYVDLPMFKLAINIKVLGTDFYVNYKYMQMIGVNVLGNNGVEFIINVDVKPKIAYYIGVGKSKYYKWIDDFISTLIEYMDKEEYFKKYYFDSLSFWNEVYKKRILN